MALTEAAAVFEHQLQKGDSWLMVRTQETEHELDTAVLECKEFDEHTVAILDENTVLRAGLGEQVAVVPAAVCEHGSAARFKICCLAKFAR